MKILSVTLADYTRLALSGTTNLTFTPTEAIQLIIGTNGSGKSSLIAEITPLPADPSDFDKGGYKRVTILHKGERYILTNDFSSKPAKHSFYNETQGKEENEGGTVSVQKDLVKKVFGITPEIHQLLLGAAGSLFTNMGPGQRRYWFTQLSETSYDYAIGLFNRLKEKHRDVVGARKLSQKRLVAETAKVMSEEERAALERDTEAMYELLRLASEVRRPLEHGNTDALDQFYQTAVSQLAAQCTQLIRLKSKVTASGFSSEELIDSALLKSRQSYEVAKLLTSKLYEEHEKVDKLLRDLANAGEQNAQELQVSINQIRTQQASLRQNRNILVTEHADASGAMRAFDTVRPAIEAILLELPENTDRRFTPQTRETTVEALRAARDLYAGLEREIRNLEGNKAHLEAHQKADLTECPNCQHKWKIGFNELVYQDVCQKLVRAKEQIGTAEASVKSLEEKLRDTESYLNLYRGFFSYVSNWPILKPLWDHLIAKKYLLEDPKRAMMECSLFQVDLTSEIQCNQLSEQIATQEQQLRLKEQLGNQDASRLKERLVEIDREMHTYAVEMGTAQKEITYLEGLAGDIRTIHRLNESINTASDCARRATDDIIEHRRREGVLQAIRELQSQLARKEDVLNSVRLQVGIIEDLTQQIATMEADEKSLAALVKELSPTDGLIAEGLLGFIRVFVAQMNAFIKQIWTYPLTIIPCAMDPDGGVDLTYKFPIMVDAKQRADVAMGSEGIKEVINMAFIITAMKYLGLSESPLYMDEFCATMDKEHRFNAIQAVKNLVETRHFTQLYMISHNLEFHGAFPNAQLCVLNRDNIVVPHGMDYNKHVTFG